MNFEAEAYLCHLCSEIYRFEKESWLYILPYFWRGVFIGNDQMFLGCIFLLRNKPLERIKEEYTPMKKELRDHMLEDHQTRYLPEIEEDGAEVKDEIETKEKDPLSEEMKIDMFVSTNCPGVCLGHSVTHSVCLSQSSL